jgi:hypothetical protein
MSKGIRIEQVVNYSISDKYFGSSPKFTRMFTKLKFGLLFLKNYILNEKSNILYKIKGSVRIFKAFWRKQS